MAEPPKPPKRPAQSERRSAANKPRSSTNVSVENARVSTLRDAVTHALETDREFKKTSSAATGDRSRRSLGLVMMAMLGVTLYSWVQRPAMIWGPPVRDPAPAVQQANLRMSMFLFGMKVDRFRQKRGSYPETLGALGDSIPGISYARLNDSTFELRGHAANREVVFRSDMPGQEFLGNAREIIQSRPKR